MVLWTRLCLSLFSCSCRFSIPTRVQGLWWFLVNDFSITAPIFQPYLSKGLKSSVPTTFPHPNSLLDFPGRVYLFVLIYSTCSLFSLLIILLFFLKHHRALVFYLYPQVLLKSKSKLCVYCTKVFVCGWLYLLYVEGRPFSISDRVADWNMSYISTNNVIRKRV